MGYLESLFEGSPVSSGDAGENSVGTVSRDTGPKVVGPKVVGPPNLQVCTINNCKTCRNISTCQECDEGFGLNDDKKDCLTDECDQIAGGVREVCQDYRLTINNQMNQQINEELIASYIYQDMAQFFDRADVAYRGFAKFFNKASAEERDHAQKLIDYMNKRGGNVKLNFIQAPEWEKEKIKMNANDIGQWTITQSPIHAVAKALQKERDVNRYLLDLHKLARTYQDDPHLQDFLESEFLTEQVDSIKQLADWKVILERMTNEPVGIMIFDQELYDGKR